MHRAALLPYLFLIGLTLFGSMLVSGCGSATGSPAPPPTPTPGSSGINFSSESDGSRLRITVTDVELTPDGRLRFWIFANNWSPDVRLLPLESFVATDAATNIVYRADPLESRWIEKVEANYGGLGQITLDRPLPDTVQNLRISFSGVESGNDLVVKSVPISVGPLAADPSPSRLQEINNLELASPFVDGLQLKITRVEVSDGIVKVEAVANHSSVGLAPFGPRKLEYNKRGEQGQEAEKEEREWRHLQSTEFAFQDENGRIYEIDPSRSQWDVEIIPNGTFRGFMTISDTLQSSVSQLSLLYTDVYHGARVALKIDGIPVPRAGAATVQSQASSAMSDCRFVTSTPDDKEIRIEENRQWMESQQLSGSDVPLCGFLAVCDETATPEKLVATPTPLPIPGTRKVDLSSIEACGVKFGVKSVTRDEYGTLTFKLAALNRDLPYGLSLGSFLLGVNDGQNFEYSSRLANYDFHDELRAEGEHAFSISIYNSDLPPDTKELNMSLTLPGGQVLEIDHVPLP